MLADMEKRIMAGALFEHKQLVTVRNIEHLVIANFKNDTLTIYPTDDKQAGLDDTFSLSDYTNFEGNIHDFIESELVAGERVLEHINSLEFNN